jgi:hypothetical protein
MQLFLLDSFPYDFAKCNPVRTATPIQKNKGTKMQTEINMFGNETQPIVTTSPSPTAEWLQFLCITSERLEFTANNL